MFPIARRQVLQGGESKAPHVIQYWWFLLRSFDGQTRIYGLTEGSLVCVCVCVCVCECVCVSVQELLSVRGSNVTVS